MSINKIPVELWDNIVELCHDANDWKVGLRLSQVNKHLRYTMLSTPIPWRRLHFTVPDLYGDETKRKSLIEWTAELNKRADKSMKHIKVIADSETADPDFGIRYLLGRFNAIDTFTLNIRARKDDMTFLVECPKAKKICASVGVADDYSGSDCLYRRPHLPDLFELGLNSSVESVNCADILLHSYLPSRKRSPTSLKSATIDFSVTYTTFKILLSNYRCGAGRYGLSDDDDNDDDAIVFDDNQFKVVTASKQLESLNVAYTDAHDQFRGVKFPSLKSLSVQGGACNFLRKSHLPVLESLTLTECRVLDAKTWEVFSNCMIKHLNLIDTMTPSFIFSQACIVSLSLQFSSKELRRLLNSSGFANFTSLKALNVSFTHISLNEVLLIVGQVNLEQLLCDLPETRERGDCTALEGAIAEIVPHYWTIDDQYYKDIQANNDLKQYFFPPWTAKED